MIKLNHDISLDLYYNEEKTIDTKEYDKDSRYITVHLTYKGEKYTISGDNIKATIKWLKPDKKAVFNDCIINSDNTITINLTEQMLLVSGVAKATLTLYDIANDQVLSTTSFNAIIEANAVQNDTIVSSDEYDTLNKMILDTGKHIEALKELDKTITQHELIRENNESTRKNNENIRQNNETDRQNNENKRIEAEAIRVNNENIRKANEIIRQNQESDRQTNTATAISKAEAATKKANDAADGLQNKLDSHHFVLTEDKDVAGGVPSLDSNAKVPINELYEATTTSKGITQLTDSITSTSTTTSATPNSVKTVNDNLNSEISRAKSVESILAPLETPHLTGIPTAPNAPAGNNSKRIATTAFVQTELSNHNSSNTAHSDIRELISTLTTRLNALADSDDTTLDQLSEIVAYIKSNRTLIENVTTNKVNVTDIVDNLTSTATNKPLSAKQGKVLNELINALSNVVNEKASVNHTHDYVPLNGGGTIRDDDGDRITISPISIVGDTNSYIDGFSEIGASSFKEDGKYLKDKYADKSHTHAISEIDEAVTGIKGNAETSYRIGNVNITPANIGAVSKDEFDGLEIGGRNLALDTSSQYSTPFTSFNGYENQTPSVAKVLTGGLKEGDIITVSIVFKYNNIVPTSGHNARFALLQGYGNVTNWNGAFPAGKILEGILGDDEIKIIYQSKINQSQAENDYWIVSIRCDWIQSGSMQWKQLKIEKGNKATDWTPAPEDVDSSIAEVDGKFASYDTQLEDLTANIQQNDVIANISSSSSTFVTKSITIVSADYRAYVVVLCNGDEFDHTVINTYTWLSSMVNGYYRLELYDPSNNVYIGYIEFVLNSIDVYLNKYDEYYVDIYGLISL